MNTKIMSLVLTQDCNLNCGYCYEHFKSKKTMSFDIAKSSIEKHCSDHNYDDIVIDFFGGEPFLEFDLMQQIFEYVESLNLEKPYHFSSSTNGTLIHGNIQTWLISKQSKYHVALSLDGTKSMHNKNRSNSYSKIDFDFFKNCYPDQPVKMTLSLETLPYLAEGVKHIHALGLNVGNNLAYGLNWSDIKNIEIFQRELSILIEYYLEKPHIEPCTMLSMGIETVAFNKDTAKKWCGVQTSMVAIDVDGVEYPCHSFLPISIGDEKATISKNINFSEVTELLDDHCVNCALLPICPTCYGSNFYTSGSPKIRDKNLCNYTKIRALACSYFEAKKMMLTNDNDTIASKTMAEAIMMIQNDINLFS